MLPPLPCLGLALSLLSLDPPGIPQGAPERGNVLLLVADDLGIDQFSAYHLGADPAPTPNLTRLAVEGVLFTNAWSQPTCSPTRATIQTGRYGFRTGIGQVINPFTGGAALPINEVTIPEMLDLGTGATYAHAAIGKWHLGTSAVGGDWAPNMAGYSHYAGSLEGQLASFSGWRRVENGVASQTSRYATSVCVDDALVWIYGQDRPWFCVINFQAPHAPFHRPPPTLHTQVLPAENPRPMCSSPGGDPRPFYKAAVEAKDTEIGRLLANLPPGERAKTTIFFLGDNGTDTCITVPPFGPEAKGSLSESGVRVPLLASGYRVDGRGRCSGVVSTSDLFATVAELAGVDLDTAMPGVALDSQSLVPCLADSRRKVRSWVHAEVFTPNGPQLPLPACPTVPVCQTSIGFDGPGDVTLASCGLPLYGTSGANVVPWQLTGARPNSNAWLLIGPEYPDFVPLVGATLVSSIPSYIGEFVVGADGTLNGLTWTGTTSRDLHYQFVVADRTQPSRFAVSNALRIDPLPTHARAVRRARYKLIRNDPCHEELYDLQLDPFEKVNLLERPLSSTELTAYDRLALVLETLQ